MLIRQSYLSAKLLKERERKQRKAYPKKQGRRSKKEQVAPTVRYFDDLGFDYPCENSDDGAPGPEAYAEHVEYDWNDIAQMIEEENARLKKRKKRKQEQDSDAEVITKEERKVLQQMNEYANDEIQKAREARDQFTQECLGMSQDAFEMLG